MRRGNRHLIGVVLGGRSGGSRDATMRNLLAENLEKGTTKRTVAAITERNPPDRTVDVAAAETASRPSETAQPRSALPATETGLPPTLRSRQGSPQGCHAAAAGQSRYRTRRARRVARFQPGTGPLATPTRADARLCRSGTPRPAAGRATE